LRFISRALTADLPADRILLQIQRPLFARRDVTIVESRHRAFFLPDRVILAMQLDRLPPRNFTFSVFLIDSPVLIFQPVIDLVAARMIALPSGFGVRAGPGGSEHRDSDYKNGGFREMAHGISFEDLAARAGHTAEVLSADSSHFGPTRLNPL
jgi:hypothetical protein